MDLGFGEDEAGLGRRLWRGLWKMVAARIRSLGLACGVGPRRRSSFDICAAVGFAAGWILAARVAGMGHALVRGGGRGWRDLAGLGGRLVVALAAVREMGD